jgi:hypothetical protein
MSDVETSETGNCNLVGRLAPPAIRKLPCLNVARSLHAGFVHRACVGEPQVMRTTRTGTSVIEVAVAIA